jgi:hypothetical protein
MSIEITDQTLTSPGTAARAVRAVVPCGVCFAAAGVPCRLGPEGDHLARYLAAEADGRISRAALAAVISGLDVITRYRIVPAGGASVTGPARCDAAAELGSLAAWIDAQLADEMAGRQQIAEEAAARVRDIALALGNPPALAAPAGEAAAVMTPGRLARELAALLDGPHADEHTAAAGELCAEAVRFLIYATGSHSPAGLVFPSTVYTLAAHLSSAAWRMQQLATQLSGWLAAEEAAGRLGTDDGRPVAGTVAAAQVNLASAAAAANRLSGCLGALQNSISGLNGRGPDRAGGAL